MTTLSVPDFKTTKDFVNWVDRLNDKEIQAWKTKDWLAMYEKLLAVVDNDRFIEKDYKQYIKDTERMEIPEKLLIKKLHRWLNTPLNQIGKPKKISPVVLRQHFVKQRNNIAAFVKLYNNYRFEPQQLKAIKELAKDSGKKISAKQDIDLSEISGVMSDSVTHSDNLSETAKKVDEIVKNNTDLPDEKSSRIIISRHQNRGSADASNYNGNPRIRLGLAKDDALLDVMFHESAHNHLQNSSSYQQEMLSKEQLPLKQYSQELNKDFYQLMWYNMNFYLPLNDEEEDTYIYSLLLKKRNMTNKEVIKKRKEVFKGYKKQPCERYSYIFGIEAEREFRRRRRQYSERNAFWVKAYLSPLMGEPVASKYVNGNIRIEYNSPLISLSNKELIRRFNYLMEGADTKLLEGMNIHEEGKKVVLTIPTEYGFWEKIDEVMRNNYLKNNLVAYSRNKLAQKIDKTAASLGIDSNLQDYKMSKSYKNKEIKISRKLEKINRVNDYSRKKNAHDLQKVAGIIKDGLKSARQFIKNKLSKDR